MVYHFWFFAIVSLFPYVYPHTTAVKTMKALPGQVLDNNWLQSENNFKPQTKYN